MFFHYYKWKFFFANLCILIYTNSELLHLFFNIYWNVFIYFQYLVLILFQNRPGDWKGERETSFPTFQPIFLLILTYSRIIPHSKLCAVLFYVFFFSIKKHGRGLQILALSCITSPFSLTHETFHDSPSNLPYTLLQTEQRKEKLGALFLPGQPFSWVHWMIISTALFNPDSIVMIP